MATKLTFSQRELAKGFLNDIFIMGKAVANTSNKRKNFNTIRGAYSSDATIVCDEIVKRGFNFYKVDDALQNLSYARIANLDSSLNKRIITHRVPQTTLAAFIAVFCAENKIYWDDISTHKTPVEMEQYKLSIIGRALWENNCFVSQLVKAPTAPATAATTGSTTATPKTSTPRTPGQPPKNNYKASGPQSGNVRGLISTPNQKVFASGITIYKVVDASVPKGGKEIRAFIKPLDSKGSAGASSNKVFIGTSTGYTDLTCWFDDKVKADDFLGKCQAAYTGTGPLEVRKSNVDKNGYFEVSTEYGDCGVAAVKLNEACTTQPMKEAAPERDSKEDLIARAKGSIYDIDVYDDAFWKYE